MVAGLQAGHCLASRSCSGRAGGAACLGFPGWAHRGGRSRTEAGAAYSGTFGILRHADGYVPAIAVGGVAARGPARRDAMEPGGYGRPLPVWHQKRPILLAGMSERVTGLDHETTR